MTDIPDQLAKRTSSFLPLRVRWPDLFRTVNVENPGEYPSTEDALRHLATNTLEVDERIVDAYLRIRLATDTPCRVKQTAWHRVFGLRPVPKLIADLNDLQRRLAAMRLLSTEKDDERAIIMNIVGALEQQAR